MIHPGQNHRPDATVDGGGPALDIVAETEDEFVVVCRAAAPAFDSRRARKGQRHIEIASRVVGLSRNSGGQLQCGHRNFERVDSVIGWIINAATRGDAGIPLHCAGHQLVRAASGENKRAGISIVTVQSLGAASATRPDDEVVGAIRRSDERRTLSSLRDQPCAAHGGRACWIDPVRHERVA